MQDLAPPLFGADVHRAELDDLERGAETPAARLPVERLAFAVEADGDRDCGEERREQQERRAGHDHVDGALQEPRAAAEPHRRQRHDRHALDVVELGVGREDLEVPWHDRDLHVWATNRADEIERLLVAADGRREQHAVDVMLVDEPRDLGR